MPYSSCPAEQPAPQGSESPDTSHEILSRLARFSTRVVGTPIAHVAVEIGGRRLSAGVGLDSIPERRSVIDFAEHVRRSAAASQPVVQQLESGLVASGVALTTASGEVVGALCVADVAARSWTSEEHEQLRDLATMVATEVDLRQASDALEQLANESELRRRELEAVVEASPVAILAVDPDGNVQTWNRAAERIFGWSAEEVIGRPSPAVPENLVVECGVVRERSLQAESITGLRTFRRRKDGKVLNVSLSTAPLYDVSGEIVGVMAVISDITAQVAAEEALRASEARKSAILEASLDCVITIDHEGSILEWNPAAERTFGYRRVDVLGRKVGDVIVPPALRERHKSGLTRYLTTGESRILGRRFETTGIRADGSEVPIELALTRVDVPGPPVFTAFARDLTERRQAEEALRRSEEQLRQAQKLEAIGRVAGGIAHDFNNIVSAIRGYSELLAAQLEGAARDDAVEIVAAADRATRLVRQLLAFSRSEPLEPATVDLNAVVRELEPLLRTLVGKRVELVTRLDPSVRPLMADASKLEQVLVNLVVNARDAMLQGGRVTVETRRIESMKAKRGDNLVSLSVADTGVGMGAEAKARAFEPFFTTKASTGGTGLGLATVYGIVKQSGGQIEVESESGVGTTFTIYLPSLRVTAAKSTPRLTPRQREVLLLLAEGLTTKTIAARLVCAEATVRNHVNAVISALSCHSRLEAVVKAQSLGLI